MSGKFEKSHGVTDNNAQPAELVAYAFTPEVDGVFAGCYITIEGVQTGNSFSVGVISGTPFTFYSIGGDPPADAVGFLGRCSVNLRCNRSGTKTTPFYSDAPSVAKNYQIPASESLVFGRVNG